MADSVPEAEQLRNLGREVGEFFGDSLLEDSGFREWQQFFRYLREKSNNERLIIAIDQFPYLVHSNKGISSIFQKGIDTHLKESNSYVAMTQ